MEQGDSEEAPLSPSTESERKKNIVKTLPSRQIAVWRMKTAKRKGTLRKQKSSDGKVYTPIEDDDDDSVLLDINEDLAGKEGKYIKTDSLRERVTEKRRLRSSSTRDTTSLSSLTELRMRGAMKLKQCYKIIREVCHMELWRGHFKEIEGTYGNGILSYFTFLKWLLEVNTFIFILTFCFLVIPQAIYTDEVSAVIVSPWTQGQHNATLNVTQSINVMATTISPSPSGVLATTTTTNQSQPPHAVVRRHIWNTEEEQAEFLGGNVSASSEEMNCRNLKVSNSSVVKKDVGSLISDFMQGVGWINSTLMFYGGYSAKILLMPDGRGSYYNMPFAYFVVSSTCFLFVLLITLFSVSSIFEESYVKDGVRHYNSYSNKAFGSWDMCIIDAEAAQLKMRSFVIEVEADLAEDMRLANLAKRTRGQQCKIYTIRTVINLIVIGLSIGAGYVIYESAQLSLKSGQSTSQFPSKKTEFFALLKSYASSITLSVLNAVLPALFFFLSHLEDWNPRVRVNVDLLRTVTLKLASVAVLMVSFYEKIIDACMLCWENAIAAEMYKLIWMDFIVVVIVVVVYHTPRRYVADHLGLGINLGQKIGRPVFSIPQNVLELVYGQCLIWIGMWFSPLLPLMGCVKFFIIFYAKKVNLKYNCKAEEKAYRAGRSNYFFMILLLGTFFLCVAAVAYGVTQVHPSGFFGPFRGLTRMYDIIFLTIRTLPLGFQDAYGVISSPVFLIVVVLVICLGLYFFYATAKIYSRMIRGLKEELTMESRDKRYLLQQITADDATKRNEGAQT